MESKPSPSWTARNVFKQRYRGNALGTRTLQAKPLSICGCRGTSVQPLSSRDFNPSVSWNWSHTPSSTSQSCPCGWFLDCDDMSIPPMTIYLREHRGTFTRRIYMNLVSSKPDIFWGSCWSKNNEKVQVYPIYQPLARRTSHTPKAGH